MVSAASTVKSARKLLVLFWNPRIFSLVIFQSDQINRWMIKYWTLDLFWHPNVWPSNFGWSVAKISHLFDKLILKLTRYFEWLGSVLWFQLYSLVLVMFCNPVRIFPKRRKKSPLPSGSHRLISLLICSAQQINNEINLWDTLELLTDQHTQDLH